MIKILFSATALLGALSQIFAQSVNKQQIESWSSAEFSHAVEELKEALTIPNNGRDSLNMAANAAWCMEQFKALDFQTSLVYSSGVPHVIASNYSKSTTSKTVLFYLQIDGQPVDTSEWHQESPYQPVLKMPAHSGYRTVDWEQAELKDPELRIFARSASDSKGPALSLITALKILQEKDVESPYHIKVIMDFQEEMGSPTLPALVQKNRGLLDANVMVIMDGTRHVSNLPTLTFGARGIATIQIKTFGAKQDLHSGQYGNYSPNPAFYLADILAGMKDTKGRVTFPGFYEGINLTDEFKRQIRIEQEDEAALKARLGIAEAERVGDSYQEALQYPSLNIRGLQAAWVEKEVRTIIPAQSIAEIDIRLVPETPAQRMIELVRNYIVDKGYHIIESEEPTEEERVSYPRLVSFTYRIGSQPFRTPLDSPIGHWLSVSMERIFGANYVKMQATGGSQPIAPFISTLGIPAISVRIPNPDNNIHGPNENLRLGNFLEGIRMCLSVLTTSLE